jgi:hypothetical protein
MEVFIAIRKKKSNGTDFHHRLKREVRKSV